LRTDRPSAKLDHRFLGPFEILAPVGRSAFRLKLPPTTRAHPVFHVSLLERWHPDSMDAHQPDQQVRPVVVDEDGEHWEVDHIVDARWRPGPGRRALEFKIRWAGFTPEEDSWEPWSEFDADDEAVLDFYREHPGHPAINETIRRVLSVALE
jgi:hypothetical protein